MIANSYIIHRLGKAPQNPIKTLKLSSSSLMVQVIPGAHKVIKEGECITSIGFIQHTA